MQIYDAVALGDVRSTETGYLTATPRVARTGIQTYLGRELDRPDLGVVRVLRPEEEVFDSKALASLAHRPVTMDHPAEPVTAKNWRQHSVGQTGGEVTRDGDWIRVPLALMDAAAIADVQAGKCQLSVGYACKIDWTSGITADGQPYDAIQRNIVGNHLAVVDAARAGPDARIGDRTPLFPQQGDRPMPGELLKVVVDGLTIETTAPGKEALDKVQSQLRDAQAALDTEKGGKAALEASHAAAIQAKDGEIAALKAQVPDTAALDALLATRQAVIGAARKVLGDSYDAAGKPDAQIRREAVAKRLGDKLPADATDEFVAAAFTTLGLLDGSTFAVDPVRDALKAPPAVNDSADTYEARMAARFKEAR